MVNVTSAGEPRGRLLNQMRERDRQPRKAAQRRRPFRGDLADEDLLNEGVWPWVPAFQPKSRASWGLWRPEMTLLWEAQSGHEGRVLRGTGQERAERKM